MGKGKAKRNKILSYGIEIGSYKSNVTVLYSNSLSSNQIYAEVENEGDSSSTNASGDGAITICKNQERIIYIIFDKDSTVSMLHHECIHAVSYLFYLIQTEHTDATDEVFAYLSDSLFSEIYKIMLTKFKINKESFLGLKKPKAI